MAILTLDQYIASNKQLINYYKTVSIAATAATRTSIYQSAGSPGAGTLAGANLTSGTLITAGTVGFPLITTYTGSYYLSRVSLSNSVSSNIIIQDLIYKAGSYAFNAAQTLTTQPSISGRVPGGTDYSGVSMYFECVTAFTGIPTLTVTYTNQSGVAGRTSGAVSLGVAPIVGKLVALTLQAGDTGVQKVESVTCTVATVGTFNILLVRDLYMGRIPLLNGSVSEGLDRVGLPEIFLTSALNVVSIPDGAASGVPSGYFEIASG